jgi:hypothetical protein
MGETGNNKRGTNVQQSGHKNAGNTELLRRGHLEPENNRQGQNKDCNIRGDVHAGLNQTWGG